MWADWMTVVGFLISLTSLVISIVVLRNVRNIRNFYRLKVRGPTKPILEIVDRSGAALWKFPNVSALNDLLYSVQNQVAGAKELLDDFMKE